ncbi:MAG: hypothetical protein FWG71_01535 [Synergistaceae bacterium]|nr:hypothetical protein [Synergistaceae bacterium]
MSSKLKAELRRSIEDSLTYDEEIWSTTAFKSFLEQYKNDYKARNGRLPDQEYIDKFARYALETENWVDRGKTLYLKTVDKITDQISKSVVSYAWKQNFKDRTLASAIMAVSIYTGISIFQRQETGVLYGALGLAVIVSLIFSVKIIWNSINLKD